MNKVVISNKVIKGLPEFVSFLGDVSIYEQPSFYFGNLGLFLTNAIKEENVNIVNKAFHLINELLDLNDKDLDALVNIGVLEILTDSEQSQRAAIEKLNEKGRGMFLELFDRFHKLF